MMMLNGKRVSCESADRMASLMVRARLRTGMMMEASYSKFPFFTPVDGLECKFPAAFLLDGFQGVGHRSQVGAGTYLVQTRSVLFQLGLHEQNVGKTDMNQVGNLE